MAAASAFSRRIDSSISAVCWPLSTRPPWLTRRAPAAHWSHGNPVDIIGDADAAPVCGCPGGHPRRRGHRCGSGPELPTALASSPDPPRPVATIERDRAKGVAKSLSLAVWLGEDSSGASLSTPHASRTYATEADAVRGFVHLVRYRDAQSELMARRPTSSGRLRSPIRRAARRSWRSAIAEGRTMAGPAGSDGPAARTRSRPLPSRSPRPPTMRSRLARPFIAEGGTVAVKILSPEIVAQVRHRRRAARSDDRVGRGRCGRRHLQRAGRLKPGARMTGVPCSRWSGAPRRRIDHRHVGRSHLRPGDHVRARRHGGGSDQRQVARPAAARSEAGRGLIARTRVSRLLQGYRDVPAADDHAVALTLVKLASSSPICRKSASSTSTRSWPTRRRHRARRPRDRRAGRPPARAGHPLAMRPYPREWEREFEVETLARLVRPVRPEDEAIFLTSSTGDAERTCGCGSSRR